MAISLYSEIFDEFVAAPTRAEKIEVLRNHGGERFKKFLKMAFDPRVVFDVKVPDFKPSPVPAGLNYSYLDMEVEKLYRFIKDHSRRPAGLPEYRQQSLLLVLLETLHIDEANLLVGAINKKLNVPYLTHKIIKEAFPELDIGEVA